MKSFAISKSKHTIGGRQNVGCGIGHSTRMSHIRNSAPPTFHLDVSHPEFLLCRHSTRMSHIQNSAPPTFYPDVSHPALDAGWERRAFQLSRSDIFGSADSAYPESFAAIFAQCRGVLLKLLDTCDRHFEIFFFRYLMSKSPNSPCNLPIIGFLSY